MTTNQLSIDQLYAMKMQIVDEAIAMKKAEAAALTISTQPVQVQPEPITTPTSFGTCPPRNDILKYLTEHVKNQPPETIMNNSWGTEQLISHYNLNRNQYYNDKTLANCVSKVYVDLRSTQYVEKMPSKGCYKRTEKGAPTTPAHVGTSAANFFEEKDKKSPKKDWDNKHLWKPHMLHILEQYHVPSAPFEPKDIIEPMVAMGMVKNHPEHKQAARRMFDKLMDVLVEDKLIDDRVSGQYTKIGHFRLEVGYFTPETDKEVKDKEIKKDPMFVLSTPDKIRPQIHDIVECMHRGEDFTTNEYTEQCDWTDCTDVAPANRAQTVRNVLKEMVAAGKLIEIKARKGDPHVWRKV